MARLVTFIGVVIAWVFFRAESFDSAWIMLKSMSCVGEPSAADLGALKAGARQWFWTAGLLLIAWLAPNSQEIVGRFNPALDSPGEVELATRPRRRWEWQPTRLWAVGVSALFCVAVMHLCKITEFLYFQF
jgi:hypothetical protein